MIIALAMSKTDEGMAATVLKYHTRLVPYPLPDIVTESHPKHLRKDKKMARGEDTGHDPRRSGGPENFFGPGSDCPSCGGPSMGKGKFGSKNYSQCTSCGSDFMEGFRMPPGKSFPEDE